MTDSQERAAITLARPQQTPPDRETYELMMAQAKHLVDSGLLPGAIDKPQKVITIIRKGRELGLPDLYALTNIAVIDGKPTLMADAMLLLVYRAYGGNALRVVETTREKAVVRYKRPEWDEPSTLEFTMDDAKLAGLLGNPRSAWAKYPANMLRWRAISAAAKLGFPEVLAGLYTPEELGAPVIVDPSGEAWIDAEASEPSGRAVDATSGETADAEFTPAPSVDAQDAPEADVEEDIQAAASNRLQLLTTLQGRLERLSEVRGQSEKWLSLVKLGAARLGYAGNSPTRLNDEELAGVIRWAEEALGMREPESEEESRTEQAPVEEDAALQAMQW